MVLAPNGVEEEQGPGYVEYAIYGGEGELPELGEIEAAAGEGLVEVVSTEVPDDWADRWQDFHRPILVGDRLWLRPSWEEAREGTIDVVVDPGRAFGTGAHPTTRLCLELLLELAADGEAEGPLTDLGTGSGLLAIAAAKLGWSPVSGYDHEQPSIEAATSQRRRQRRRAHPRAPQPPREPATTGADDRRQPHRLRPARRRRRGGIDASVPDHARPAQACSHRSSTRSRERSPRPAWSRPTAASTAIGPPFCSVAASGYVPGDGPGDARRHRLQDRPLPAHPRGRAGLRPDLRLRALLLGRAAVPAGDAGDPRRGPEMRPLPGQPGDDRPTARRALSPVGGRLGRRGRRSSSSGSSRSSPSSGSSTVSSSRRSAARRTSPNAT